MASVTLKRVWITNMATPSVSVQGYSNRDKSETYGVEGSVRTYVSGRRRIVTTPAVTQQLVTTLHLVGNSDYALLQSWAGQLLLYRDNLGRRVFGTFFSLSESYSPDEAHTVGFTFEQATFNEAV